MHLNIHHSIEHLITSKLQRKQRSGSKYVVVDSENQEDVGNQIKWSLNSTRNNTNNTWKRQRNSIVTNNQVHIDRQIRQAQSKIQSLQKQCNLLDHTISRMIQEESELIVQHRKRQRSQSLKKQHKSEPKPKPCPIHNNKKISMLKQQIDEIIDFKLSRQSMDLSEVNNTLPFCKREVKGRPQLQGKEIRQIKYKKKEGKNIGPIKISNKQNKKLSLSRNARHSFK